MPMAHPFILRYPMPYQQRSQTISSTITTETTTTVLTTAATMTTTAPHPTTEMTNHTLILDADAKNETSKEILEARRILKVLDEWIQYLEIKKT